jgi:phosphatidylglycerophosphatase A
MSFPSSPATSPAQLREQGIAYWKQVIVSGLYTGLSPVASGTVGSAVAALVYFIPGGSNVIVLLVLAALAYVAGLKLAGDAERVIGNDPSFVTIDEFAGQWITLASPFVIPHPYWVILGFFVFRAFDIAKIWPASYFDRQHGAVGIMTDDVVAGIYANIATHLIWFGLSWILPVVQFTK